jgi:hypothetical protein
MEIRIIIKGEKIDNLNSKNMDNRRQVVSDYFRLIMKKDMDGLLNLFTDDCIIYEPFSKVSTLHNSDSTKKTYLKGRFEVEPFLKIVMMACDRLEYEINFIDEPMDIDREQPNEIFDSTFSSSLLISVLTTFYRNQGEAKLKERFTFHVASEKNHDSAITMNSDFHNSGKIRTLWIQPYQPRSTS